ncbi:MAG: response regulator transcription factor [Lachnospiraceae bacterium]|nr:response regulator transcription factor [Lachnospiraceae bacterium]
MYQMMIIDDEPVVREGLKHLLPWEEYEFQIVAEGIDGNDGLKKVVEYKPDLVLVDVKMPGMNGLELIKKAKESGYEGVFLLLTGYSDFEFAKSAVSLGVRAYLLKPIDEEELAEVVKKVRQELEEKNKENDAIRQKEESARREMFRRLLLYSETKEVLREQMRNYEREFAYPVFCVAILHEKSKKGDGFIPYPSDEKLKQMIKDMEETEYVSMEDCWILICKGHSYEYFLKKLLANNEKVKNLYKEEYFIFMGHDVAHWEDLHYSYESARMLMRYRFLYHAQNAITIKALEQEQHDTMPDPQDQLCAQIEIGDLEGMEKTLHNVEGYCKAKLFTEPEAKIYLTHQMIKLKMMLEERYDEKKGEFPDFDELTRKIKNGESLFEILNEIKEYAKEVSHIAGASGADNVVKRVSAYLEKNYHKDIKLEAIAKMFNYNSAYLGKVFKKEMGESFNNVLDHIRIENAKKLLSETDLKVYQVSERIGYSNIDYFYAKFKRYVGVSPKEYKKVVPQVIPVVPVPDKIASEV